jgi:hypothetical protein
LISKSPSTGIVSTLLDSPTSTITTKSDIILEESRRKERKLKKSSNDIAKANK